MSGFLTFLGVQKQNFGLKWFNINLYQPFKRQPHKTVKHTQAIRRQKQFDRFVAFALKGFNQCWKNFLRTFGIRQGKSSRSQMFFKVEACNFIKKRLQHRYFSGKIVKFLRTDYFRTPLWWLLLSRILTCKTF